VVVVTVTEARRRRRRAAGGTVADSRRASSAAPRRENRQISLAAATAMNLLVDRYEVGEPRLLGVGAYGPVIRARDVHTKQLVAVKVFNAAEAFHSGRLTQCKTLADAQHATLQQFRHEVRVLQKLGGARADDVALDAEDDAARLEREAWVDDLPAVPHAVVELVDFSRDASHRPGRADDGCCYLVVELGLFTLEQLARDSREPGRRPSVPEARETLRSLLAMLSELHRCGVVLTAHSPRQLMRFPSGWKVLAADALRPAGAWTDAFGGSSWADASQLTLDPVYVAPELAGALAGGGRRVQAQPSMDVWSVSLICLELVLPRPLLHESYERVLARHGGDVNAFFRWLAHDVGPLALPAAVGSFSKGLHALMAQQLLQRDPLKRGSALASLRHAFFAGGGGGAADLQHLETTRRDRSPPNFEKSLRRPSPPRSQVVRGGPSPQRGRARGPSPPPAVATNGRAAKRAPSPAAAAADDGSERAISAALQAVRQVLTHGAGGASPDELVASLEPHLKLAGKSNGELHVHVHQAGGSPPMQSPPAATAQWPPAADTAAKKRAGAALDALEAEIATAHGSLDAYVRDSSGARAQAMAELRAATKTLSAASAELSAGGGGGAQSDALAKAREELGRAAREIEGLGKAEAEAQRRLAQVDAAKVEAEGVARGAKAEAAEARAELAAAKAETKRALEGRSAATREAAATAGAGATAAKDEALKAARAEVRRAEAAAGLAEEEAARCRVQINKLGEVQAQALAQATETAAAKEEARRAEAAAEAARNDAARVKGEAAASVKEAKAALATAQQQLRASQAHVRRLEAASGAAPASSLRKTATGEVEALRARIATQERAAQEAAAENERLQSELTTASANAAASASAAEAAVAALQAGTGDAALRAELVEAQKREAKLSAEVTKLSASNGGGGSGSVDMKRVNEMLEAARRHADGVNAQLSEAEARNATLSAEVSRLSAGGGGVGGAAAVTSHELSLTATQHELRSQIATLK